MTDVLADLRARDLVHTISDEEGLAALLAQRPVTLYYGLDPTADSLHVGNLIGLLVLRRFREAGHRPLGLAGGATGMIGDPSGRSEERNLLDEETVRHHVERIRGQIARVVDVDPADVLDNLDWTADLTLVRFLRDVGKHVTVNSMMGRESVRARLVAEQGISFTEFTYMLLQANDFAHLASEHGCRLQIGGSDQWGNIVAGIDLVRRLGLPPVYGLCWPLLLDAAGQKMGKTTGDRVWLAADRLSPYRFHQHWVNAPDEAVRRLLLQLTLLPVEEVEAVVADHEREPGRRAAQRRLAAELTTLVHGRHETDRAEAASAVVFGGAEPTGLDAATWALLADELPTTPMPRAELVGADLVTVLAATSLCSSRGDARRKLAEGSIAVNGRRVGADAPAVAEGDLACGRYLLLRRGRSAHDLVVGMPG